MASSQSATSTPTTNSSRSSTEEDSGSSPLWRYVTKIAKTGDRGGNFKWVCNFCNKQGNVSYSRVKAHLLKIHNLGMSVCPKVSSAIMAEMERLVEETGARSRPPQIPLPPTSSNSSGFGMGMSAFQDMMDSGVQAKKRKGVATAGNSPLEKAFNIEVREQLKMEIARFFYSSGLPFHVARNPHYVASYTFAANNMITGFLPPGYNALRTTLLQKERTNIERLVEPIKGTWREKGVSIATDGWTDSQKRPLINFMAVSDSQPIFLKAINCEGDYKDKFFIARLLKEVIIEIGPQKVVQVITDNAPVCKSAGMIIESQFPHIFWTPCVVHTLNLALQNICAAKYSERIDNMVYDAYHWITDIADEAMMIKIFITNHSMRLAMYNEFVNLKLLSVAQTRFASIIIMLKRLKLVKQGLLELVISERWSSYREDDTVKAQAVKDIILNDLWWGKVDYILSFTGPIYDMLRFADTDKPALHLIYDMWDCMIEKVKKIIYRKEGKQDHDLSMFYDVVYSILVDRWNKSNSPLHCLAHSLNLRYYSEQWLSEAPNRVPPHKDNEISQERNKCIRRYFPNSQERNMVSIEYANFSGAMNSFSNYDSLHDRGDLDPRTWWICHGSAAPILQNIALKLLGQPCSSSCCERNWSTYNFIHSMKRNKIQPQCAEDLVYVHTNLRLLSRRTDKYWKGESRIWDIGGDAFDPFDGVGELEIANLSLDEPDMEAILFTDNDDGEDEVVEVRGM